MSFWTCAGFTNVEFVPGAFPCVRLRCYLSQQECQTAQRLVANAFSMEKEHLLKSVKPFSDQVPHLIISFWFWFAFCPLHPQLFFFVFEMCALLHILMEKKKKKKIERHKAEFLSSAGSVRVR